jgi:hypothetical protein
VFSARLPLSYQPTPAAVPADGAVRQPANPNGHTVLVIEDDPRDREWLTATLAEAGYTVEGAATGAEALHLLNQRSYDAITLDLMLPDMSGWDVLRAARAAGLNREVPVIVVTVLADKGTGVGFAIHDFLEKPTSKEQLLDALKRAGHRATDGATVLLVDDDKQDLRLFQNALKQKGYVTIARSNAVAALRAATEQPPDIIVLDLVMPRMDGFEFLRRFRAAEHGRHTPVIVLTSKQLVKKEQELLGAMAEGVVTKGDGSVEALLAEISMTLVHRPPEERPASPLQPLASTTDSLGHGRTNLS